MRHFYLRNSTPCQTDWTIGQIICCVILCKDVIFKCCIVCTVSSCAITTIADKFVINDARTLCISIETDWGALRKDGVLDDWATTIYHDHTGPNLIFGQVTIPRPTLYWWVLCNIDSFHREIRAIISLTTTNRESACSVGNLCSTARWVRANIICQIIFCADVKACAIVGRVF